MTFPREDIAKYSGIPIPPNKRNWRKQKAHVQYMNNQREFKVSMGECSNGGRPDKKDLIRAYMLEHPQEKNKSKIAKDLHLHRNTVSNHFDAIWRELHVLDNEDGCVVMGDMSELRALLFGNNKG